MAQRQGDTAYPEVEITNIKRHSHPFREGAFYWSAEVLFVSAKQVWGVDRLYGSWMGYEKVIASNGHRPELLTEPGLQGISRYDPPAWLAAKLQDIVRPLEDKARVENGEDKAPKLRSRKT